MTPFPLRLLAGLALLGLGAPALHAAPDVPPFYAEAARIAPDGRLGQVVAREPVATSIPGAQAWRIAYVSSDVAERKTISTALVVAPVGAPPAGGRPIIAWAHGTTGTAQNCGPSQVLNPVQTLNEYFLPGGTSWTDFGLPSLDVFIREGMVVVGTDYQGLGAGGRHQYAVAATQGRDVINAARAAAAMPETGAGRKALVFGWSQGGGATLAAANLRDYIAQSGTAADGVQFLGFAALAPHDVAAMVREAPRDAAHAAKIMQALVAGFSSNVFNFAHFAMTMWGTQAAFPALRLDDLFTAEGAQAIDTVFQNKCMHAGADAISYAYGTGYAALLNPEPRNPEAWVKALVDGSVVPVPPVAPVVIYWGTHDTVVPPVMGQLYQAQMCRLGGTVARVQLPGAQTHFSTPGASAPFYLPWMRERLAGTPVTGACPTN